MTDRRLITGLAQEVQGQMAGSQWPVSENFFLPVWYLLTSAMLIGLNMATIKMKIKRAFLHLEWITTFLSSPQIAPCPPDPDTFMLLFKPLPYLLGFTYLYQTFQMNLFSFAGARDWTQALAHVLLYPSYSLLDFRKDSQREPDSTDRSWESVI